MNSKGRVCIVGAGLSGLLACKHVAAKGFTPTVYEASDAIGGIWVKTFSITCLQVPRDSYQFSDHPWDESKVGTTMFPTHDQVMEYLDSYANRFGLYEFINLGCRVVGIEYVGVEEEEIKRWEEWGGNGEAFGGGDGVWHVSVQRGDDGNIEVHETDFLILCIGRFSGYPNIPTFPLNSGPEVFKGQVIHSLDYSDMGSEKALQLVKGKRVTVVGCKKSGLDIATECANVNGLDHPCTMICRSIGWIIPDYNPWGIPIKFFYYNRIAELFFHKPEEGFLFWFLATVLFPLRWLISKVIESYYRFVTPMKKYKLVPDCSFTDAFSSCSLSKLPEKFYERVGNGTIIIKKSQNFRYCENGVIVDGETEPIETDLVIYATGYSGDKKLVDLFKSQYFQKIVASSPATTTPLYRDCIFPRIPKLAVIGFAGSLANLYTFELRSMWVAHFLDGGFRLPRIRKMEENVKERVKYGCAGTSNIWYCDIICKDLGLNPKRKKGLLADWFVPYSSEDYAGI